MAHLVRSATLAVATALLATACGATQSSVTSEQRKSALPSAAGAATVTRSSYSAGVLAPVEPTAARLTLAAAVHAARRVYANEINGSSLHRDLAVVAADQTLLADLRHGQIAAAQREALRKMKSQAADHITRIAVLRGGRQIVNAVWNGNGVFVVKPLRRTLHLGGATTETLLVSVQDVVGYIKLIHAFTGAQAVVSGASGQVRTSLPGAVSARLPRSGATVIAGRRYVTRSFHLAGWGAEPLTVWVLVRHS